MSGFSILVALNVVALVFALFLLRPATIIIAANQILTLAGLANIARYGQPHSQGFLPMSVFSEDNLEIARNIFTITSIILLASLLLPGPRANADPRLLPRVPKLLVRTMLLYFVLAIMQGGSIFTASYTELDKSFFGLSLGGAHAFVCSVFLYEIVRRTRVGELKRRTGFAILLSLFVCTDYLKGQTGLATGFVLTAIMLVFSGEPRPLRRVWITGALLITLASLAASVRQLRSTLHAEQGQAFTQFASTVQTLHESRSEGVESLGNGTQYAAHVLECVTLYESGVSRQWSSIYRPLLYTFQPSFLVGPLGIVRAKEAAWELADYFIHGGGIFTVGELYWNGGYLCVLIVFAGIALLSWRCDTAFAGGFGWMMVACQFTPNLLQGMGYGFAQVSRGAINGMLALGIYWLVRRVTAQPSPISPGPTPHTQLIAKVQPGSA
jgi:hypothetical protein